MRSSILCSAAAAAFLLLIPTTATAADYPDDPVSTHEAPSVRTAIDLEFSPFNGTALATTLLALVFIVDNSNTLGGGPFRATQTLIRLQLAHTILFHALKRNGAVVPCEEDPEDANRQICDAGVTEAGARDEYTLEVTPTEAGSFTIAAEVETEQFDPDPTDNDDEVTVEVVEPAALCGQKYEDLNGNGRRDEGEPGLNGFEIELRDAFDGLVAEAETADVDLDGDGTIDPDTERGVFCFDPIEPGAYSLYEDVPAIWRQSAPESEGYDVSVESGERLEGLDFGNFRPGSLGGTKWIDANGDGLRDPSEETPEGVLIELNGTDALGNAVSMTTTTDASGWYQFDMLHPGSYTVSEPELDGYQVSYPESGSHDVDLVSGDGYEGLDFGNEPLQPRLRFTKTADASVVGLGDRVKYTIVVENVGDAPAENVVVEDVTSTSTLVPISASPPCETEVDIVSDQHPTGVEVYLTRCEVGTLEPGASVTLELTCIVSGARGLQVVNIPDLYADNTSSYSGTSSTIEIIPAEIDAQAANLVIPSGGKRTLTSFDVYIDSTMVVGDLTPGSAVPFQTLSLRRALPYVHLVPAGASDLSEAVLETWLALSTFEDDSLDIPSSFSLVFTGTEDAPEIRLVKESRRTNVHPDSVEVAVLNTGFSTVDIRRIDDTPSHNVLETLVEAVAPDSVTPYLTLAPVVHSLQLLSAADGSEIDTYRLDLSTRSGQGLLMVLTSSGTSPAIIDADGEWLDAEVITSSEPESPLPRTLTLHETYPNPFSTTATIAFELPEPAHARLSVYDVLGRELRRLIDAPIPAGRHETVLDAAGLPAGYYLLILDTGRSRAETGVVLAR